MSLSLWIVERNRYKEHSTNLKGFKRSLHVLSRSLLGNAVLVSTSVVGYELNLVGIAKSVASFMESFESPTYEHVLEFNELA